MTRQPSLKERGNYISEWYGQRIFPDVSVTVSNLTGKSAGICPFLSDILDVATRCVKNENSSGVCTISSNSNGSRQDWLVCPYRVINANIVEHACELIFKTKVKSKPRPVSILKNEKELVEFKANIERDGYGFLFFQDKLGGEISVLATPRSPEISFDVTLVEVKFSEGEYEIDRYGILEIQTMDFHGSYKHAVADLRDALRLHPKDFSDALNNNRHWASNGIEGPNIANVFKRTFYQMLLKFKLAGRGASSGTVFALPKSVWDSWQPFLGAPDVGTADSGLFEYDGRDEGPNSYICVFDVGATAGLSVSPISIVRTLQVSPEILVDHAFNEVPNHIVSSIEATDSILSRIKLRLINWWPELRLKVIPIHTRDVGVAIIAGSQST